MGSKSRTLMVTAFLAVLVAVSGCQTGQQTSAPDEMPSVDELREQTTAAMEDVETSSFTMDMTMDAQGQTITMSADGKMDIPAKQMKMTVDMSGSGQNLQVTQYIDGNTMYMKMGEQWIQREAPGQNVWQNNQLTQQQQILEAAEIELNGTTTVDGESVYRVDMEANESTARQILEQSAGQVPAGSLENVDLNGFELTQYVDVETSHVRKVDMQMDMAVQGQSSTVDMTMTFSDFNSDVSIEIPDAAKSA